LRRVTPISATWGFDRGTPIDRYYVDRFFNAHRQAITGRVLEIQTRDHIKKYGWGVSAADTLDVSPEFAPTFIGTQQTEVERSVYGTVVWRF